MINKQVMTFWQAYENNNTSDGYIFTAGAYLCLIAYEFIGLSSGINGILWWDVSIVSLNYISLHWLSTNPLYPLGLF